MKRWLAAGGVMALLFVGSSIAQESYKLRGRVNIRNKCSKEAIPEKIRVSIEIQLAGEDRSGREVVEAPDKPFVIDFPKGQPIKNWKITNVRRMDRTPVCSCICCDPIQDKESKTMKCQWTPEASEAVPPDNEKELVINVTCECARFVPDSD